jgi:acyl-CoA synthetase (NDP forming)
VLTADACAEAGLTVAATSPGIQDRLREVLPAGSALGGPVNATAAVGAGAFGVALQIAADGADALIAVVVRGGRPDLIPAITAARLPVPVAAVVLDQPEAVRLLPGGEPGDPSVPAYACPEAAARALARAARYGSWCARPPSTVPEFGDLREQDARSVVASFLARMPGVAGCPRKRPTTCCAATASRWWSSSGPPTPTPRPTRRAAWAATW